MSKIFYIKCYITNDIKRCKFSITQDLDNVNHFKSKLAERFGFEIIEGKQEEQDEMASLDDEELNNDLDSIRINSDDILIAYAITVDGNPFIINSNDEFRNIISSHCNNEEKDVKIKEFIVCDKIKLLSSDKNNDECRSSIKKIDDKISCDETYDIDLEPATGMIISEEVAAQAVVQLIDEAASKTEDAVAEKTTQELKSPAPVSYRKKYGIELKEPDDSGGITHECNINNDEEKELKIFVENGDIMCDIAPAKEWDKIFESGVPYEEIYGIELGNYNAISYSNETYDIMYDNCKNEFKIKFDDIAKEKNNSDDIFILLSNLSCGNQIILSLISESEIKNNIINQTEMKKVNDKLKRSKVELNCIDTSNIIHKMKIISNMHSISLCIDDYIYNKMVLNRESHTNKETPTQSHTNKETHTQAPERILELCERYLCNEEIKDLNDVIRTIILGSRAECVLELTELILDNNIYDINTMGDELLEFIDIDKQSRIENEIKKIKEDSHLQIFGDEVILTGTIVNDIIGKLEESTDITDGMQISGTSDNIDMLVIMMDMSSISKGNEYVINNNNGINIMSSNDKQEEVKAVISNKLALKYQSNEILIMREIADSYEYVINNNNGINIMLSNDKPEDNIKILVNVLIESSINVLSFMSNNNSKLNELNNPLNKLNKMLYDKTEVSVMKITFNVSEQQQQQKYHSQLKEMAKCYQPQQQQQHNYYSQHIEMAKRSPIVATPKMDEIIFDLIENNNDTLKHMLNAIKNDNNKIQLKYNISIYWLVLNQCCNAIMYSFIIYDKLTETNDKFEIFDMDLIINGNIRSREHQYNDCSYNCTMLNNNTKILYCNRALLNYPYLFNGIENMNYVKIFDRKCHWWNVNKISIQIIASFEIDIESLALVADVKLINNEYKYGEEQYNCDYYYMNKSMNNLFTNEIKSKMYITKCILIQLLKHKLNKNNRFGININVIQTLKCINEKLNEKLSGHEMKDDSSAFVRMKCAPETILNLCDRYLFEDEIIDLNNVIGTTILDGIMAISSYGECVLAELILDEIKQNNELQLLVSIYLNALLKQKNEFDEDEWIIKKAQFVEQNTNKLKLLIGLQNIEIINIQNTSKMLINKMHYLITKIGYIEIIVLLSNSICAYIGLDNNKTKLYKIDNDISINLYKKTNKLKSEKEQIKVYDNANKIKNIEIELCIKSTSLILIKCIGKCIRIMECLLFIKDYAFIAIFSGSLIEYNNGNDVNIEYNLTIDSKIGKSVEHGMYSNNDSMNNTNHCVEDEYDGDKINLNDIEKEEYKINTIKIGIVITLSLILLSSMLCIVTVMNIFYCSLYFSILWTYVCFTNERIKCLSEMKEHCQVLGFCGSYLSELYTLAAVYSHISKTRQISLKYVVNMINISIYTLNTVFVLSQQQQQQNDQFQKYISKINSFFEASCKDIKRIDESVLKSGIKLLFEAAYYCHDTFESVNTWIAILAIVFDTALFSLFCSKWYSVMSIFMEEMATSLLAQFSLVIMGMISGVINVYDNCNDNIDTIYNRNAALDVIDSSSNKYLSELKTQSIELSLKYISCIMNYIQLLLMFDTVLSILLIKCISIIIFNRFGSNAKQNILDIKNILLFKTYGKSLEYIQYICMKKRINPSIGKNMSKLACSIAWSRQLLRGITISMNGKIVFNRCIFDGQNVENNAIHQILCNTLNTLKDRDNFMQVLQLNKLMQPNEQMINFCKNIYNNCNMQKILMKSIRLSLNNTENENNLNICCIGIDVIDNAFRVCQKHDDISLLINNQNEAIKLLLDYNLYNEIEDIKLNESDKDIDDINEINVLYENELIVANGIYMGSSLQAFKWQSNEILDMKVMKEVLDSYQKRSLKLFENIINDKINKLLLEDLVIKNKLNKLKLTSLESFENVQHIVDLISLSTNTIQNSLSQMRLDNKCNQVDCAYEHLQYLHHRINNDRGKLVYDKMKLIESVLNGIICKLLNISNPIDDNNLKNKCLQKCLQQMNLIQNSKPPQQLLTILAAIEEDNSNDIIVSKLILIMIKQNNISNIMYTCQFKHNFSIINIKNKQININLATPILYIVIYFSLLAIAFIISISETNEDIRLWIQQSESELNAFVSDEINTTLYNKTVDYDESVVFNLILLLTLANLMINTIIFDINIIEVIELVYGIVYGILCNCRYIMECIIINNNININMKVSLYELIDKLNERRNNNNNINVNIRIEELNDNNKLNDIEPKGLLIGKLIEDINNDNNNISIATNHSLSKVVFNYVNIYVSFVSDVIAHIYYYIQILVIKKYLMLYF